MMGDVSPETCWASYRYGFIRIWYTVAFCWTFYGLYYNARIHEHQGKRPSSGNVPWHTCM